MKIIKQLLLFSLIITLISNVSAKTNEYERMAQEFSSVAGYLTNPKIAIIPFSFIDKRADTEGSGSIISERLTMRIVKQRTYKVVDRQHLEKILSEQKLQASGIVDSETAKSLGKILGVEAIITGSLMEIANNRLEVNAKLIKTETAEILTAASMIVVKDWGKKMKTAYQEPEPSPTIFSKPRAVRRRGQIRGDGFFDFFILQSNKSTMKLVFKNTYYGLSEGELYLDFKYGDGPTSYRRTVTQVGFDSLKTYMNGMGFGLRILGFFDYVGPAFELLSFKQTVSAQKTTFSYGSSSKLPFNMSIDDYLKVSTVAMNFGIYARFLKKIVQPYIGTTIGLSLNTIYSPYISSYQSRVWVRELDSLQPGFMFSLPIGVRVVLADTLTVFAEMRSVTNTIGFSRGRRREKDKITTKNDFLAAGLCFSF